MGNGWLVISNLYRKLWDAWEIQGPSYPPEAVHPGSALLTSESCPVLCWPVPGLGKQRGKQRGSGDSNPQQTLLLKPYKSPTGSHN